MTAATARCTDAGARRTLDCTPISGAAARLCQGAARIHQATCAELVSAPFLEEVISAVGLVPDPRGAWLYGNASTRMVCQPSTSGCLTASGRAGLWQEPKQLSKALVHIASSPTMPRVERYVEVGVWTAWTCVFVSAFLSRLSAPGGSFQGIAVDLSRDRISTFTRLLLKQHNVTYVPRWYLHDWLRGHAHWASGADLAAAAAGATSPSPYVDLCFIDANHSYPAVRADYESFAPICRSMMFHDIQDSTNLCAIALKSRSSRPPLPHCRVAPSACRHLSLTTSAPPWRVAQVPPSTGEGGRRPEPLAPARGERS